MVLCSGSCRKLLHSSMTLDKLQNFSVPQFSPQEDMSSNNTCKYYLRLVDTTGD